LFLRNDNPRVVGERKVKVIDRESGSFNISDEMLTPLRSSTCFSQPNSCAVIMPMSRTVLPNLECFFILGLSVYYFTLSTIVVDYSDYQ
jgi:hypothetical protein